MFEYRFACPSWGGAPRPGEGGISSISSGDNAPWARRIKRQAGLAHPCARNRLAFVTRHKLVIEKSFLQTELSHSKVMYFEQARSLAHEELQQKLGLAFFLRVGRAGAAVIKKNVPGHQTISGDWSTLVTQ